MLRMQMEMIKL